MKTILKIMTFTAIGFVMQSSWTIEKQGDKIVLSQEEFQQLMGEKYQQEIKETPKRIKKAKEIYEIMMNITALQNLNPQEFAESHHRFQKESNDLVEQLKQAFRTKAPQEVLDKLEQQISSNAKQLALFEAAAGGRANS